MAQVAKRDGIPNLTDTRLNTTPSSVNENLQQRIRSLLHARNERTPVRAPLPSPEPFRRTANNRYDETSWSDAEAANPLLGRNKQQLSRETRSRLWRSEVAESRFDGSDFFARIGSNTLIRCGSPHSSNASFSAANIDNVAKGGSRPSRTGSTSFERHSHSPSLRYSLRVLPPKRTTQDDFHIRPSIMHVPGSYTSDRMPFEDDFGLEDLEIGSGPSKERFKENFDVHDAHGIIYGSRPSAAAALQLVQTQTRVPGGADSPESKHAHQTLGKERTEAASKPFIEPEAPSRVSSLRGSASHKTLRPLSTSPANLSAECSHSSLSAKSSVTPTARTSSVISASSSHPRIPTLTARPDNNTVSGSGKNLYRTSALEPPRPQTEEETRLAPPRKASLHHSYSSGQVIDKAINDLEQVLTEALEIADIKYVKDPQSIERGHADADTMELRSCSRTSSESLSSSSAYDEERQTHLRGTNGDWEFQAGGATLQQQLDGKPLSQTLRSSALSGEQGTSLIVNRENSANREIMRTADKPSPRLSQAHEGRPFIANDWAYNGKMPANDMTRPRKPSNAQQPLKDTNSSTIRRQSTQDHQRTPQIHRRMSSFRPTNGQGFKSRSSQKPIHDWSSSASDEEADFADLQKFGKHHGRGTFDDDEKDFRTWKEAGELRRDNTLSSIRSKEVLSTPTNRHDRSAGHKEINLSNKRHFSIREPRGFSLSRSHRRKPIARDWTTHRKRFVATVNCITTTLLGLALGIYAGEVPAIQYTIADEHHYAILGNVVFFLGLAASTLLSWPLPVLHGRKPYTVVALALLLPLQFPQALAVSELRSPNNASVRLGILLPRAISGLFMGLANINFMTTLLDLFGASLQSRNPHQEVVNINDVRRHGGGMGAWLGIWTWCSTMSIGVGFLIGAGVVSAGHRMSGSSSVSWGFWIVIIATAFVLLLNVMIPETRRSAYRRSMAEVRTGTEISRRVARGEIKMHLDQTGPKVWHEELFAGYRLSLLMIKQPGFLILALYQGWIYGQIVLIIALLGALLSKYYHFHPQYVGLGVSIIPFGALFGVPFQMAGIFSRSRKTKQRTDSMTFEKQVTWSSHLVRRTVFTVLLPFASLGYTLASNGRVNYMAPILFAGLIGFLSTLAIAECNGLIMETFDTSDLQPGMTGRPRKVLPDEVQKKRTNFSCFPRVTAAFAIAQTFAFLIAAGATGWGGVIERHLGAQVATAVVAGILLVLTLLLFAVLWRFKTVQVIPSQRYGTNVLSGPEDEWKPIIIGNPSGTTRRMSILELGNMSRWTEIRRRNKLGSVS